MFKFQSNRNPTQGISSFSLKILLLLSITLIGGVTMANAQDKPPLLGTPSAPTQTPPSPSPLGVVSPPPPAQGVQPPPPPPPPPITSSSLSGDFQSQAVTAVSTAKKAKAYLTPGKVWVMTGARGESEIKAAIIYDGLCVAVLRFKPEGTLLPLGVPPVSFGVTPKIEIIKHNLPEIVNNLEVLNGAEYREPENAWIVPLAYKDMIVAHLKVYADGIHIIPDYPANQEMQAYGR